MKTLLMTIAMAAALAATAAPDITDRLQNLGIPLIGRYPDGQITQSTYARNVWDMKLHAGRVFIGSGNSANTGPSPNAGPAQVWEIDPATGTSQLSYQIGGEQADLFRVFGDGCLYVPDHDPPGTSSYNCYYKRDLSGVWNKGGWVQDEVHVYDMAEFDGKMFACGYYLWRSDDGGATWYKQGIHSGRNYAFLPYGDQLMTSTSYYDWNSSDVFRYWNKAKQTWDVPDAISAARAFPDQSNLPGNYLKLVRPAQFGNKCLYIGAYEFNDHQNDPFGAYVSTFNGTTFSATAIPAATGEVPWDILVKDGTAYLLVQDRTLLANTDRRYVNRVFASTDAASWTELFSFRATTFAMSFEKVGDTFYFGMGTKDRVCDECGTIYRVNPTAGPVIVNFPTLTQSVSEGAGQTTVTVQLSTAAAEDVTVPLTLGGTAISGVDYSSVPTTVVIPAGSTTATFDIALVDDALFEVAETLILTMGAPTHAIAGSASKLTITIADNDGANKPAVRFASESQDAVAGSTASLVASLTKVSGAATTIGLLFEGTATNNLDYTVDKTSVTIPAGETEATVSFTLLERAAGKTVIASIKYWPSNADMGAPRIHTMTVAASEAPPPALPTAAFASAAQTVQENAGTVSISVVLSQASSSAVSIPFTLGGTALAGADYQIPASPLTIPAGQTSGTIDIVLAADGLAEPAETIIVVLGTPTGATLGATTTHTLTIAASEAAPQSAALAAPSYQAQLTVQGYEGAELENFPVLVRLSPQTVDGFHYGTCQADGSDVVFVDANGEPLDCQLDTWNPSGESLFWVRLPALRPGGVFYVRWGDSEPNVDGARSAATWNANYGAVWHMGEESGVCANSTVHGSAYDATPKGNTDQSVRYDGSDAPVGGARTTSKDKNAYLEVPNYDALQCGDTFTFSGWMRLTGTASWGIPLARKTSPDAGTGWEMTLVASNLDQVRAFGKGAKIVVQLEKPGFDKTWVHFALVYSGANVSVYGNGALRGSGTVQAVNDNGLPLCIGNTGNTTGTPDGHYVKGAFDELRLMKGAASADWVKAEHDTVAQADFLAYGASGPAWTAPSLCISGVGVVASGDSFVDLSAMLHGLGENAETASIHLAYGFDETSLVKTQDVGTATATGPMTLRLARLLPQRVYCVQAVAVNDQGERAVSAPIRVMTVGSPDAFGVAGLNQTFFTGANKDWSKSYAELPQGTDWRDYTNDYRIYRRELGVLAAYFGGWPLGATKRKSEVWGDEVYWPENGNGGQWVYWGQMRLEGGKSYRFRTHIDDYVRVQVTNPSTGLTTTLLDDVADGASIVTSSTPFVPTETGWHPIEIRLGDGSGEAGGKTSTDGYLNTKNMGWSDDGGTTWKLMMDPGDGSLLRAGDLLAIRVDEVVENGALQKLTLTFPPAEEARDLYAVWGGQHGGATTNGWTHVQKLTTVTPGCGTYEYTLPGDWGADDNRVIRFFLDGTPRSCSSSVYWRDCSEPLITGLSLDGRGGDTLKVTGSLASFDGSSCTLKVLVGQTPEMLDQVWTGLPGSGLQEPGSFDLTLFEDTESQKYLNPGETYYVCVEATAGGSVSRSQVMKVTMAQADAFESAEANVNRRTVTFSGILAGRGMGESAKVSLWVGESNDEGTLEQVGEELDVQKGAFSFTHKFDDWERTYYWQFRAVSTSAGGTAVVTTRTAVASCTTADNATYTWKGGVDDEWENPANWENNGGDVLGYPNGTQAKVNFLAGAKARIVLRTARKIKELNMQQTGIEVTFACAPGLKPEDVKLEIGPLRITGAGLRLTLDGVALSASDSPSLASDAEVRLSNGASWYQNGRLENYKGGRLWLDKGTSLSCSDYYFSGGLTVIDDATLTVRGSVLLGKSVPGGKIRFVGKQPAFRCSAQGAQVRSDLEAANVRLEFELPVGGYATPPFENTATKQDYILGHNGTTERLWPITVYVAPGSPGLPTTNTTLISWGKGICPKIIQTAAKPGANATFVWSGGNDAHPVSLGVRLSSAGLKILVR